MRPPRLITPPAEAPVTLEDFKQHVRVSHGEDDTVLQAYLDAATAHLDGWSGVLGRCLITQTWAVDFDAWDAVYRLPFPDVSDVVVTYTDADDVEQTVAEADYAVLDTYVSPEVRFWATFSGPTLREYRTGRVKVTFAAGFGAADSVPRTLKVAIMHLAAHWYENREAAASDPMHTVPLMFDALIAPYRRLSV